MDGIINFLKPTGLTSSQAVGHIKRALNRRDIGHLGTLDPFAAGVLPIAVGKATRLFDLFLTKTKAYRAVIAFGYTSNTLDSDGVVEHVGGEVPSVDAMRLAAVKLTGEYPQIPPNVSAKSVDGVRAYDLARTNKEFVLAAKTVSITRFDFVRETENHQFIFDIECGSGTYIRSLARDLGILLNTCAIVTALIRTRSGEWSLEDAVTETELIERKEDALISKEDILVAYPTIDLPNHFYTKVLNGVPIEWEDPHFDIFVVKCKGEMFGLGKYVDGMIKISRFLHT